MGSRFIFFRSCPVGILFAALTLLDGGIELAAGFHSINNVFIGLIANPDVSALSTPSLFVINMSQAPLLFVYFVDIFGWALLVVILNLKYKWFAYPWAKPGRA